MFLGTPCFAYQKKQYSTALCLHKKQWLNSKYIVCLFVFSKKNSGSGYCFFDSQFSKNEKNEISDKIKQNKGKTYCLSKIE